MDRAGTFPEVTTATDGQNGVVTPGTWVYLVYSFEMQGGHST
jgi:hypothetical protein